MNIKPRKIYWLAQLYGWSFYLLLVIFWNLLTGTFSPELFKILLVSFSIGLLYSHFFRYLIVKLSWLKLSIAKLILRGIIGSALAGFFISFSIALVSDIFFSNIDPILTPPFLIIAQQFISWTITMQVWTLIYLGYHFLENYRKEEIKNLMLESSMNEVELQNLRAQLNPHFMFNALNSIRALIDEEPERARHSVTQLSSILRYSLTSGKKKTVPIVEELTLIKNYLALELVRFEDRMEFEIRVNPNAQNVEIPPLMLQTLVENAVKHGIARSKSKGFISINVEIENNQLCLKVLNTGTLNNETDQYNSTNIGIANTKKRLKLLFADKAFFSLKQIENKVEALIQIPLN